MGLADDPVIAISGLWMNYTDRMVLKGIDLKVYRGQIIIISVLTGQERVQLLRLCSVW